MATTAAARARSRVAALGFTWRAVPPLAAAIALGFGALASVRYLARPLGILILAITIGEALEPMVTRLERRMRRSFAIALVYLALMASMALVAWLLMPELIAQGREIGDQLPALLDRAQAMIAQWDQAAGGGIGRVARERMGQVGAAVVALPLKAFTIAVEILLVVFLSAYWLLGSPALLRFVLSLLPPETRTRTATVLEEMGDAMGGYVRGAAISAAIMGALAWVGLLLIGVNYALALGALTMLGEPIPYVGPILVGGVVALVALAQSPAKALLAVGLYTLLQQIESNFIAPNVLSRETRTSQALVIFALVAGAAVGGLLGALVAIPLAGALQVFVLRVVAPAIRQRTGAQESEQGL